MWRGGVCRPRSHRAARGALAYVAFGVAGLGLRRLQLVHFLQQLLHTGDGHVVSAFVECRVFDILFELFFQCQPVLAFFVVRGRGAGRALACDGYTCFVYAATPHCPAPWYYSTTTSICLYRL